LKILIKLLLNRRKKILISIFKDNQMITPKAKYQSNPEISDRSVGWCDRVFGRDVLAMLISHSLVLIFVSDVILIPEKVVI
jgi:hypothetical protein